MQSRQRILAWAFSGIGIVLFISALMYATSRWSWTWTGFNKTLWDWMQLLIIPVMLALGAFVFNLMRMQTEQRIVAQRDLKDQEIATQKRRDDLLQIYLDRIAELLLNQDLRSSHPDAEVRTVARARTLTVLPQLDSQRKGSLIQFLSESKLVEIIDLRGADLRDADLSGANLRNVKLYGADLRDANLRGANLRGANLHGADLSGASLQLAVLDGGTNLSGTNLCGTNLSGADLRDADLYAANLFNANLRDADLHSANLRDANLRGANLSDADLHGADLSDADLNGADLSDANLHGVAVLRQQRLASRVKSA